MAIALLYAWANITADLKMQAIFDGQSRTTTETLSLADAAVARFPFDPYIRAKRRYIRRQINAIPPRPE